MDLMTKFAAVKIEADNRISEQDKQFCEQNQAAYEAALGVFTELSYFWSDVEAEQRKYLGEKGGKSPHNYLSSKDGPAITKESLKKHLMYLHGDFISVLTRYFNSAYHVTVDVSAVSRALLPQKPAVRRSGDMKLYEEYSQQMQSLTVRYQDVVDQIILRLGGRSFAEQAFYELYGKCHRAAWDSYYREPWYERKKDTLQFTGYFCKYKGWPFDGWELDNKMKEILRGAAHYETECHNVYPDGFSPLLGYGTVDCNLVEFPLCKKIRYLRMYKNNRVDLKFASAELAEEFVMKYLGTVL